MWMHKMDVQVVTWRKMQKANGEIALAKVEVCGAKDRMRNVKKHENKSILCNGLRGRMEDTHEMTWQDPGTVKWSTMHRQIWTVDRAEIDGGGRQMVGQRVRWMGLSSVQVR